MTLACYALTASGQDAGERENDVINPADQFETCIPDPDVLSRGEVHLVTVHGGREDGEVVTVRVRKGRRDVHLFLNATRPVTWRLEVEAGASIASVYSLGRSPADIQDLPEGILAYSIGYDAEGRPSRQCDPDEGIAEEFYTAASLFTLDRHRYSRMEDALKAYANQEFASLVTIEPDFDLGVVSRASVLKTLRVRGIGNAVLDQIHLPVKQPIQEAMFHLPSGLSSVEIHDLLLSEGVAEVAGPDVTDFLCLREEAQYWALGLDRESFGTWCHAREIWDARRHLVLTAPIDLGGMYICEKGRSLVIYVPRGVETKGRWVNCGARFWTYEE